MKWWERKKRTQSESKWKKNVCEVRSRDERSEERGRAKMNLVMYRMGVNGL